MKYTLITGASGGLGRSFARECASHGQNLILVTRTGSKLHGLKEKLEKMKQKLKELNFTCILK